jgi:glycosyltransferase involved in cell wall biosynthesis
MPITTHKNKKAIVSVINDLATDIRVQKTCSVMVDQGYDVMLIGRLLPNSLPLPTLAYRTVRMPLLFKKGALFYFFFNLRLFFKLLFSKADLLFANDLDTLFPNFLISKLKKIPLIYDSHEVFCEVPELQTTPFKKKIWESIEKWIVPKLKYAITVNQSIANYFENKYGTAFQVVRNIPPPIPITNRKTKSELGLPENKKIILMQGAGININRGAEELIEAMQYVDDAFLLIIGGGDVWQKLKNTCAELKLEDKVLLLHKLPKSELIQYTLHADLGITIDKNTNLNYQYSLPNKLFDYIQCEVPILATRLVEIESIIRHYNIGDTIENIEPISIANKIKEMLHSNQYPIWKTNSIKAKSDLNWDKEKLVLEALINRL